MPGVNSILLSTILSLQTLCSCIVSSVGQYIYAYHLQTYPIPPNSTSNFTVINSIPSFYFLKNTNNDTNQCIDSEISPDDGAQDWAQERSADLFFWMSLYSSIPVIIMTYVLGVYISKLGQRLVLVIPMLGYFIQFAIWLAIIYFHLPDYWWYIVSILNALSGGGGVLSIVLTLMITDSTIESELSSRFVRLGAVQTALSAIVTLSIGYYIEWRGFTDLYWIGLGLQFICIIIVIVFYKSSSSNSDVDERTPLLTSTNTNEESSTNTCSQFFQAFTVFLPNGRSCRKTASLSMILFANIFYTLASSTFAPFLWFLLNDPFCWTPKEIGNYSATAAISYAVLSVLGMKAFTLVGANDAIICAISHVFFCASSIWLAFACRQWELYVGILMSSFASFQGTLTVSMMTKWLKPDERANALVLLTEIGTIISTFGSTFFNWVYARTVVNHRTFTLLIGAGLCAIPFILNICLFLVTRKMSDEDLPSRAETDAEPAALRLPSTIPPHAGDAACIIIPTRSLTTSVLTPTHDRSRSNSIDINETEESSNPSPTSNLIIL